MMSLSTLRSSRALHVCWLDSHIGEEGQHTEIRSECENISTLVRWCFVDSTDKFRDYLANNPEIDLIAIMSGRFARQLLPLVSPNENFHSVYIFTINIERTRDALGEEPKLKGIFNDEGMMLQQLRSDLGNLFWNEGRRLVTENCDQQARVYFDEARRVLGVDDNYFHTTNVTD